MSFSPCHGHLVFLFLSLRVGDAFDKNGVYDRHIRLNGYPFLENKDPFEHKTILRDVMSPPAASNEAPVFIERDTCTLGDIGIDSSFAYGKCTVSLATESLLESSQHSGFPIVLSAQDMRVQGYISRRDIERFVGMPSISLHADTPSHWQPRAHRCKCTESNISMAYLFCSFSDVWG